MLSWVVQPAAAKILEGHDCLDELVVVQRRWLKSPAQIWQLRERLQSLRFDVTIDAQSLFKSATAAWLSGAERRIGFGPPLGRELSYRLNNIVIDSQTSHVVDKHLELLEPLGIFPSVVEFRLPAFEREAEAMQGVLAKLGLQSKQFAVLNPGAAWASKRWPPKRFSKLAALLGTHLGIRSLIVWSGEDEQQWASDIVEASAPHAVMAPETNLRELAALVRNAAFFVGSDTGPMHLAAAGGTHCVSLYGTTDARLSGPYGSQHIHLQKYVQVGTSRERRNAANDAMRAIQVEDVFAACEQLWGAVNQRSAA